MAKKSLNVQHPYQVGKHKWKLLEGILISNFYTLWEDSILLRLQRPFDLRRECIRVSNSSCVTAAASCAQLISLEVKFSSRFSSPGVSFPSSWNKHHEPCTAAWRPFKLVTSAGKMDSVFGEKGWRCFVLKSINHHLSVTATQRKWVQGTAAGILGTISRMGLQKIQCFQSLWCCYGHYLSI